MNELRVGVIGIGHLGKEHARVYKGLRDVRLEAVADIDPSKAAIARALKVPFFEDYRELAGRVDAVSVAVPTGIHAQVAAFFLEAGCHTLVEKPMTDRLEDADHLLHLAQSNNLVLQVGHIERFNAAWMEVARGVTRPGFIEVHRLGPFTPRVQDCGVVLDLMIHDLDILLSILKSPVESFEAVGLSVLTPFEDLANVRLKFADGCIVNLTASRLTPERQRKIRIFQENAYISLDYGAAQARIFTKEGSSIAHREIRIEEKDEPLRRELANFVEAVRSGGPRLDWPAREALALALSIVRDIHANRKHFAVV